MTELLNCDVPELFSRLGDIKELYDITDATTVGFFSDFTSCTDDFECFCFEMMGDMEEFDYSEELYYEEEPAEGIEDEREAYGEMYVYTPEDLQKYIDRLRTLLSQKRIKRRDYISRINELERLAVNYVVHTRTNYYGGVWCEMDAGTKKQKSRVKVYTDYNGCCSFFEIICGVLAFFSHCRKRLAELERDYPEIQQKLAEAA